MLDSVCLGVGVFVSLEVIGVYNLCHASVDFLSRLFRVNLIKPVSSVHPYMRAHIHPSVHK